MNVFKRSSYVLKRTGKSLDASSGLEFMLKCLPMIRLFSTRNLYFELDVETVGHAITPGLPTAQTDEWFLPWCPPGRAVLSRCLRKGGDSNSLFLSRFGPRNKCQGTTLSV